MIRDFIEMILAVAVTQLALLITMVALFTVESIGLKIAMIAFAIVFGTVSLTALILVSTATTGVKISMIAFVIVSFGALIMGWKE